MINFLFRLLLAFNATSLILVVYLVKTHYVVGNIFPVLNNRLDFVSYLFYFIIPLLLTGFSLWISKWLDNDSIEFKKNTSPIKEIEQANNAFLPSYLGYFFVALGVNDFETLIFIFAILFIFTFLSQTLYFNPLFLFFRYHFYYLTTNNNVRIFLISKRKLKLPNRLSFSNLKRINDYTFLDKEGDK